MVSKDFKAASVSVSREIRKDSEIRMLPPTPKDTAISSEMVMISFSR